MASTSRQNHTKLPPLPKGTHLQKRPLPTRPPPPPSQRTRHIHVSSPAPFMSLVRRAQKHLSRAEMRERGPSTRGMSFNARVEAMTTTKAGSSMENKNKNGNGNGNEKNQGSGAVPTVVFMGTGRAVEKTLALAGWFESVDSGRAYEVRIRTRSVATVDDVVVDERRGDDEEDEEMGDGEGEDGDGEKEIQEESRVRRLSCLEVTVRMKAV